MDKSQYPYIYNTRHILLYFLVIVGINSERKRRELEGGGRVCPWKIHCLNICRDCMIDVMSEARKYGSFIRKEIKEMGEDGEEIVASYSCSFPL